MICIECTNPGIECLSYRFKSKFIRLTQCPKCGKFADKYIEYDDVILFLDILLLKPQAYRHVAFNLVEESVFKPLDGPNPPTRFAQKYRKMGRYVLLWILFEVYLKWAYEEKNATHSAMKTVVLSLPDLLQYFFFVCLLLIEKSVLCLLLQWAFSKYANWGSVPNRSLKPHLQKQYYFCVLILAVFTSLIVQCLPIVMLIWPYDNAMIASTVVNVLGVLNTIEALRMITDCSYLCNISFVTVATILLYLAKQLLLCFAVSYLGGQSLSGLLHSELVQLIDEFNGLWAFLRSRM